MVVGDGGAAEVTQAPARGDMVGAVARAPQGHSPSATCTPVALPPLGILLQPCALTSHMAPAPGPPHLLIGTSVWTVTLALVATTLEDGMDRAVRGESGDRTTSGCSGGAAVFSDASRHLRRARLAAAALGAGTVALPQAVGVAVCGAAAAPLALPLSSASSARCASPIARTRMKPGAWSFAPFSLAPYAAPSMSLGALADPEVATWWFVRPAVTVPLAQPASTADGMTWRRVVLLMWLAAGEASSSMATSPSAPMSRAAGVDILSLAPALVSPGPLAWVKAAAGRTLHPGWGNFACSQRVPVSSYRTCSTTTGAARGTPSGGQGLAEFAENIEVAYIGTAPMRGGLHVGPLGAGDLWRDTGASGCAEPAGARGNGKCGPPLSAPCCSLSPAAMRGPRLLT